MTDLPEMLPRALQRDMPLVRGGRCTAAIVYPHHDPAYAGLAQGLAERIGAYAKSLPQIFPDEAVLPERGVLLPEAYRARPLVLLGSLNTNRLILPLYARYYCATDALYPGERGVDLRTLFNPYGTGANMLLAGGSSLAGVEKAVSQLEEYIQAAGRPGELVLPYLMDVTLAPGLAKMLREWPDARLDAPPPTTVDLPIYRAIGAYALAYAWTGDERYGAYARDCLRRLNALAGESYGDRHYYLERLLRAILILSAGGFLDPADLLRTDNLLLHTVMGQQGMWWRKRDDRPPLGHRHHGKGTYEFYLIASYLLRQAAPNPAARALCQGWIEESQAFLDGLARAGFDDQDDDTTLNNLATLPWYALGEERYEFFENGNARLLAERAIALHDNMGAGAGQSGYTEAYLNMLYIQQEATVPVAAAAFYYGDRRLKWILKKLPNLDVPIAGGRGFYYYPTFMHKFDSGDELPPEEPKALKGLRRLPLAPYQHSLNNDPPLHIEPMGHLVNAPETWQLPEGIDRNRLPFERGFDKIVARGGYGPDDSYLLLQGYQGGFRWQGRNRGANCIVRFSQYRHIFLVQNTRHLSPYHLNGVYASDGWNGAPVPPIAEWLALDDSSGTGLCSARLGPYHGSEWTRHIFWRKAGAGLFVVIDCLKAQQAGEFSYTCTWRTPEFASLEGRTWRTDQGRHRFILRCSENMETYTDVEEGQSAAAPYILRQVKNGQFAAGETVSFQNLFYTRPAAEPEALDLRQISATQVLVARDETQVVGLCAASLDREEMDLAGLRARAISAWVGSDEISLSAATQLTITGEVSCSLASSRPVGIDLDLERGSLAIRLDTPGNEPAQVTVAFGRLELMAEVAAGRPVTIALQAEGCRSLAAALAERLTRLLAEFKAAHSDENPASGPADSATAELPRQWIAAGRFDGWSPAWERLRTLTVEADPPPIDGFPEQLIDTVYPELRDSRQQWPAARQYQVTLTLGEPTFVSRLRLVGDSLLEPFFKVFNPLPDGIRVELASEVEGQDWRALLAEYTPGEAIQQRFRGIEDRLQAQLYTIDQTVSRVRLTVPPPPAEGGTLVLNEVELFGRPSKATSIKFMAAANLTRSEELSLVAVNASDALVALWPDGSERWRRQLDSPATALACLELDGNPDGPQVICIGQLNGDVVIFGPEGSLRQTIQLRRELERRQNAFFGWLDCPNALQIWQRDAAGRAALMAGGYGMVVFLDPDGRIAGHSYADGSWVSSLLAQPGINGTDVWARTVWNHGVMVYEGFGGFTPSGETVTFGGVNQPMFRALRRVIPFVNGRTILCEAAGPESIAAVAEEGAGVLSTLHRDWRWKIEGGTPFTAAMVNRRRTTDNGWRREGQRIEDSRAASWKDERRGNEAELVTGGADGFLAAFALEDGRHLRRLYAGAPVTGLVALDESGMLAVATRKGILALDADWNRTAFTPFEAARICIAGEGAIWAAGTKGELVFFKL